ncbi:A/G-specific adenine glycosylase [Tenacibaculum finnmarkense]|uniref:A/G-specific adenine glycosylase n=1 Tax=Tenacibaculum finnmarkense TaxID=2781243 RepID=UPI000739397B|nr:A/G-specific adenine glycosylase [Tenacibaculum finnmarkense]ALU73813.1 A/G-specific adenine glycosylase [Tenacibaculum dicentrarchi]MBE7647362.1 A/G-specific adenine glycosylase [Tenacibaculum finnmarkense genomovar ulcerans]MCD8399486.1 A/G-specific adenine glycosylase [Tenacibaculum finnmarkense genomovar ulcerans]MCD8421446.1 A/G-specific adenine glycosylase [Tenacibaculum finnmarkense genomovar ulcerans]MCD8431893.1 A/G-specific adenine glycosylase [Tenacibaculum finnmarkense genomovar
MITSQLIYWYLKNKRDLPWRKTKDPYLVWLSEIMLQQTRVAQGLPYFISFTTSFETVFDLAKADQTTVLKLWQGLGYYSRARNLHFTAKQVANEFDGVFPNTYKELLKLKGIGDYTASAIASVCYDEAVAVVDGNVYRVLARYFGINTPINSSKGIKEFKELAQTLIDVSQPGMYNQAIMDFGALQCKPQNPLCDSCPLSESCVALDKKLIKELPVKEKKTKVKKRYFNYLVVVTDDHKTNIEQRIGKGIWQGLYQFPLIETTTAINETQLIEQPEFAEFFPKETVLSLFNQKDIVHKLSHQHLSTKFWIVKTTKTSSKTILWNDIKQYPVPVLIDNFLNEFLTKA